MSDSEAVYAVGLAWAVLLDAARLIEVRNTMDDPELAAEAAPLVARPNGVGR